MVRPEISRHRFRTFSMSRDAMGVMGRHVALVYGDATSDEAETGLRQLLGSIEWLP